MPIRLQSVTPQAGAISTSLAALSSNFDGSSSAPSAFTGTMRPRLTGFASAVMLGEFTDNSDRTGTVASTLSGVTGAFTDQTAPYNLGTLTNLAWTPAWPAVPSTSATINVPADMSFASAVQQSNRRIVVAAGTYTGGLSITGSNLDIVMSNSATLTGNISMASGNQRIRWTGGNVGTLANGCRFTINGGGAFADVLFDDWSFNGRFEVLSTGTTTSRFAFINTTFDGDPRSQFSSQNDGSFMLFQGAGNVNSHTDWIFANVKMDTHSSSNFMCRFMETHRLLVVDCAWAMDHTPGNMPGVRMNENTGPTHFERFLMGGHVFGSLVDAGNDINFYDARFESCSKYTKGFGTNLAWSRAHSSNPPNTGVVNNSTVYSDVGSVGQAFSLGDALTTETGNDLIQSYSSLPDVSGYGAQR